MRELNAYIVVKPKGGSGLSARVVTSAPALKRDEVAIKLKVAVPETLFTRPQLQASITIPKEAVSAPVVDAVVLNNVKEIIEQQTGLDIRIQLVEPVTA